MAELPIPNKVKKAWDKWNLRAFILLSLLLQTCLILFAPFRKRSAHKMMILFIWSAYLLADWVANFAVGLISSSQGDDVNPVNNGILLAFWSPFLLVHLGGPDTITAFALEDNELWLRHLLGLVFQVLAAGYVFFQSLPNKLWRPILCLFIAGIIKYAERTRALFLASLDSYRDSMLENPDPGPNYAKLMEEFTSKKEARLPARIEMIPEPDKQALDVNIELKKGKLTEIEIVKYAYRFFKIFRGLIVDLIFSFQERNESRKFFLHRTAKDALEVIQVELNFIYEVLFTKVVVVHSWLGYIFRFIAFGAIVVATVLFYLEGKGGFHRFDVGITYTLLLGAIVLDLISFYMLIFSDWTIAAINMNKRSCIISYVESFFNYFLLFKRTWWLQLFFRRWSHSISTYNLIDVCIRGRHGRIAKRNNRWTLKDIKEKFKEWMKQFIDYVGVADFIEEIFHVSAKKSTPELWAFIFEELKAKAEIAEYPETANEISSAKGDWVIRNSGHIKLLTWIDEVQYDASLLLWHIATDLCYNKSEDKPGNKPSDGKYREFSKLLSDYMLYLLIMQPTMMSAVAGIGQIRFRDTCAETKKFLRRKAQKKEEGQQTKQTKEKTNKQSKKELNEKQEKQLKEWACSLIHDVNTKVTPVAVKGDKSKSVLFDAVMLAKELEKKDNKWEIISKVWVEMMSYAASHCRANTHAQQVSKGGELITFVWLLMAHFGLGEQFQIQAGHARAKLIVDK